MTTPSTSSVDSGGTQGAGSNGSPRPLPEQRRSRGRATTPAAPREITTGFLAGRVIALGLVAAIDLYAGPPLISGRHWAGVVILAAVSLVIAYVYLSKRHVPVKYLLPGTIFLIAFQVLPVLYTLTTAVTNFGDGHRGNKDEAIVAIQTSSLQQVANAPEYGLSPALDKSDHLVFLLVTTDAAGDRKVQVGTADGLKDLPGANVGLTGKVTEADGYTILNAGDAAGRAEEIGAFAVPTGQGAIKSSGLSRAVELKATKLYDAGCDCVTDVASGTKYTADESKGYFVGPNGDNLSQGWKVNVGLHNFARLVNDPAISGPFLGSFVWNIVFALSSVFFSFALGMICALALHSPRVRGTKLYRTLLILPYAMPSFAMLLVWRDMFNTDFGLINRVFGSHIDWLGQPMTARFALILVNMWLGFPYMFLVATGALQAIPRELTEASSIDGATAWQGFKRVTLPLLLVALSPLLISSFAYNFNNFNAVQFITKGGPFPPDNASSGATDLLITYTYRLAFGGSGAQFGFAAAISTIIFAIVATMSAIAFRRTRKLEEVYS
ncbi:ABC transporter permease subunit [Hamadaea tsunoensis]|uniref:ABC transporter permease subunit n=1 Tax=Hamadaea tsunoensis TaxID=53368 RepID=UPI0003FA9465|nr:ABC transporter permease subunit [Hamadaea tsunoensis]